MKKLVATGAMTAMMVAFGASPAFADHLAVGGDVDIMFLDADQTQVAATLQTSEGDADAGNLGSAAAIDQSLHIDQSQVNAGGGDMWWWF